MDIYADNYDETVEFDDGSCIYFQGCYVQKEDYADPFRGSTRSYIR